MTDNYKPVDAFDSMTESTFIIKPSAKKNAAVRRQSVKRITDSGGFVPLFQGDESTESMELRRTLFEATWPPLEQLIMNTEEAANNVAMAEMCTFASNAYRKIETDEKGRLDPPATELATAVAFAGVNTGDHSKLFTMLRVRLQAAGHHAVLLESQYCTTLPNMLRALLDQVFGGTSAGEVSEDSVVATGTRTINYDASLLALWWGEEKQAGRVTEDTRIAVILQDFEGFPPLVVDDFVRIATGYCQQVPIVLVLGLATSYESLHQSLTKSSISMLNVERFNLQRSKECIDAVVTKMLIEGACVLAFGAEAYKSLLDQFLLYNFSISAFVRKLKYAVMDFFYAHPLSILASMVDSDKRVTDLPIRLSYDQAELVRMQRSTQRFIESRQKDNPEFVHKALTDDVFLQTSVIKQMLRELVEYRKSYSLGIALIRVIQEHAPEPLRKPVRALHFYSLGQDFGECTHWKTLSAVVRKMKAPGMEQLVARFEEIVPSHSVARLQRTGLPDGKSVQELLLHIRELLQDPDNSSEHEESSLDNAGSSSVAPKRIRTRHDMENRPFLLFDNTSSDSMLRALDKCCQVIEQILELCLASYRDIPLHEIFYYKHSLLLDTTFSAQPRAAVQTALGKTAYYINCECCDDDEDDDEAEQRILPSMQDTSIAYRLHRECGRMINIYDWYMAFASVVEKEGDMEMGEEGSESQSQSQARFMRAVEEMRLLGFIKSTQRKTDHVIRLTWGM
ncbi:Origin recognition complex subunit 3 [Linderina macrospora]|uniref:Origin recognition complex subunit 3 n=1 Tax=Linderina macrospora TaxID=4868 RepID=A0ACC1JBM2_9FUNG|nr:Origin recognition complex subunit 3 [Linderina macrospora]